MDGMSSGSLSTGALIWGRGCSGDGWERARLGLPFDGGLPLDGGWLNSRFPKRTALPITALRVNPIISPISPDDFFSSISRLSVAIFSSVQILLIAIPQKNRARTGRTGAARVALAAQQGN